MARIPKGAVQAVQGNPSPAPRYIAAKTKPEDQLRLQKGDAKKISQRMEAEGFKAHARDTSVYVWDNNNNHIATFVWRKNHGWSLMVRQPTTYTKHDLEMAVEEIQRCKAGCEAADKAWEKFKKVRTNKNWAAYLGSLAAHFFRLYTGGTE